MTAEMFCFPPSFSAFVIAEKRTAVEAGEPIQELSEQLLAARPDLMMGKQMQWLVCHIKERKPTEEVFDLLWQLFLARGHRRLSVRRGQDDESLHACIYKGGQTARSRIASRGNAPCRCVRGAQAGKRAGRRQSHRAICPASLVCRR